MKIFYCRNGYSGETATIAADDFEEAKVLLAWRDVIVEGIKDAKAILLNKYDPHSNDSDKKEILI